MVKGSSAEAKKLRGNGQKSFEHKWVVVLATASKAEPFLFTNRNLDQYARVFVNGRSEAH